MGSQKGDNPNIVYLGVIAHFLSNFFKKKVTHVLHSSLTSKYWLNFCMQQH